jgi:hypothetical protein
MVSFPSKEKMRRFGQFAGFPGVTPGVLVQSGHNSTSVTWSGSSVKSIKNNVYVYMNHSFVPIRVLRSKPVRVLRNTSKGTVVSTGTACKTSSTKKYF